MKKSTSSKIIIILSLVFLFAGISAGCSKKISETDVSYAGPILDNVLSGINNKDYEKFSKDFSSQMKDALTKEKFNELVSLLESKIGSYKEKSFSGAANMKKNNKTLTVIVYKAKYSKETKDVQITVTFSDNNGKKIIEGLYFNSPNLQKQ
jgi:S-ribosylhomocysteine lyase LuxS involved in autoinducer biosynthesis